MALRPCSAHGGRFSGPAESAYPAIVVGPDSERTKLKLCQPCFARYSDEVLSKLTPVDDDDQEINFTHACINCGSPEEAGVRLNPVFVTWYPRGLARHDAYAEICTSCVGTWAHNLLEPRYKGAGSRY